MLGALVGTGGVRGLVMRASAVQDAPPLGVAGGRLCLRRRAKTAAGLRAGERPVFARASGRSSRDEKVPADGSKANTEGSRAQSSPPLPPTPPPPHRTPPHRRERP